MSVAATTLVSPIVAPTEMSNPPTISAKLWAMATASRMPATRAMFSMVPVVAKLSGNKTA